MKSPQPTCLRAISGSSFGGGPAGCIFPEVPHQTRTGMKGATGNQPMTTKALCSLGHRPEREELVRALRERGVVSVDAVTGRMTLSPYALIVAENHE